MTPDVPEPIPASLLRVISAETAAPLQSEELRHTLMRRLRELLAADPAMLSALDSGALTLQVSSPDAEGDKWKLTGFPESRPGLHRIEHDKQFMGSPKDEPRITEALRYVHESNILGKNPLEQSPNVLGQGLELYVDLFPNIDEREENSLIVQRLGNKEMRRGKNGCFDVIVGRDAQRHVIAWHQFSTIPLQGDDGAVSFMQYTGCSDDKFMRREHYELYGHRWHGIYTLNIALMQQLADQNAKEFLDRPGGIKGYFLESEYKGQGTSPADIRYTQERLRVHQQTGAKAIMLRMPNGALISPHYQPSLGEGAEAIKLLLLYRPNQYDASALDQEESITKEEAERLLMAFIGNFDTEGFDPAQVDEGRQLIQGWFKDAESAVLVPPTAVPDVIQMAAQDPLLRQLKKRDYGNLMQHDKRIARALKDASTGEKKRGG